MRYLQLILPTLFLLTMGCTSQSQKLVLKNYQVTEAYKQKAFNNVAKMAEDQLFLNQDQYIKSHPEQAQAAIKATWGARQELEEMKRQYMLARHMGELTVGQYLNDQQGALNVLLGQGSSTLKTTSDAMNKADAAAGVASPLDLIPTTKPVDSKNPLLNGFQH